MPYDPNIPEEGLKNRVARDSFHGFAPVVSGMSKRRGAVTQRTLRNIRASALQSSSRDGVSPRKVREVRKVHQRKLRGLRGLRAGFSFANEAQNALAARIAPNERNTDSFDNEQGR